MSLEFSIQNQDGTKESVTVQDVTQQMAQNGENVVGISADGKTITLSDGQGQFNVDTESALKQLGWQVTGIKPTDADYSQINTDWRAAINLLPHDDHRKAYIEGQFKKSGIENPNVIGSGRDWFVFDPEANKYVAVTNSPDWDKSDLMEAAVKVPRFIGSSIGGAAGAIFGGGPTPMGVAGAAAGAGLGGGVADAATRYAMAQNDPMLKRIMSEEMGAVAKDIGIESLLDAGTAGVAPALGMVSKPAMKAFSSGPLSSIGRSLGFGAEATGTLVNKTAKALDSGIGRDLATPFMPVVGDLSVAGTAAQLPGMAVRGAAKGSQALGESSTMKEFFPEAAKSIRDYGRQIYRPAAGKSSLATEISRGSEEAGRFLSGVPKKPGIPDVRTEDILGNVGELLGGGKKYRANVIADYRQARSAGFSPKDSVKLARDNYQRTIPESAHAGREIGRKIGRGIENVENFGKSLEGIATTTTSGALKTARAGSYLGAKGGNLLKNAATIAQPLENKAYLRYGAEEMFSPELEYTNRWKKKNPWDRMGDKSDTFY